MKICSKCKVKKHKEDFYTNYTFCKECYKKQQYMYYRTKEGLLARLHNRQRATSKRRGHTPPAYTLEQLKEWAYAQPIFHELHAAWVASGYNTSLSPSCDRLNDYKGYSFDNIQLITWGENLAKKDISGKELKPVTQLSFENKVLAYYPSTRIAEKETGIAQSSISRCCNGKLNSAGGFQWKFKTKLKEEKANEQRTRDYHK